MDLCRICLSTSTDKDISQLKSDVDGTFKNYVEIFQFCFDIQVEADFNAKLCLTCFKKVLLFFEFKCLALRSDAYLKDGELLEPEVYTGDNNEKSKLIGKDLDVKEEVSDWEDAFQDYNSDDELLVAIKKEKEDKVVNDEVKEKEPKKANKVSRSHNINNKKDSVQKKQKNASPKQKCKQCGKRVKYLKNHLQLHQPHPKGEKYKCNKCDSLFVTRSERSDHYTLVHQKLSTITQCDICGKYYKNQHYVEVHQNCVHYNIRPYKCELCSKTYHSKYYLKMHMTTGHSNKKPFQCPDCGKCFRCKASLRLHRSTHNSTKQYSCPICHKAFKSNSNLYTHRIVHQDRRWECPECGSKFTRHTHMRRHLASVHGKLLEKVPLGRPLTGSKDKD